MTLYFCDCLNVQIFVDTVKTEGVTLTSPLAADAVAIEIGNHGFEYKQNCFLKRETIDPWTVFSCTNCKKMTHCFQDLKLVSQILMNKTLQSGEEALSDLMASPNYSQAFEIVLCDQEMCQTPDMVSPMYHPLQQQLTRVREQLDSFLKAAQQNVEARIDRFQEEQRYSLIKLKERALEDKTKMIRALLAAQADSAPADTQNLSDVSSELKSASSPDKSSKQTSSKALPGVDGASEDRGKDFASSSSSDGSTDLLMPKSSPRATSSSSSPREGLWQLELDDPEEVTPQAESSDGHPEVTRPRQRGARRNKSGSSVQFASSKPVSFAVDTEGGHSSSDEREPLDPSTIGDRVEALARSVPDQTRYIFGDRPRHRYPRFDKS